MDNRYIGNKDINKYDFLFIYEIKSREIESVCLLTQELEKRGYKVGIVNWWEPLVNEEYVRKSTEVLITAAVYKTDSLNKILEYIKRKAKVVNMQWEQVYCIKDLTNPNSPWKIDGGAKKIIHISWGNANRNKLLLDGVPQNNIKMFGNISLDFLRPRFEGFYKSKEELFREYDLPCDKKICLFISSFSWIKMPDSMIDSELKEFMEISISSQKAVLAWISKMLPDRDDIIFIYRPHPAEADNEELNSIAQQYDNFLIIREYSVKQWILVADIIYNWYSTAAAEVYFAHKNCYILRPCEIPYDYELTEFVNATFITKYEDFICSLDNPVGMASIPSKDILNNYYVDENEYAYEKIVNALEAVYHSNIAYTKCKVSFRNRMMIFKRMIKRSVLGRFLLKVKHFLEKEQQLSIKDIQNQNYARFVKEMAQKHTTSDEEIIACIDKIKKCIR